MAMARGEFISIMALRGSGKTTQESVSLFHTISAEYGTSIILVTHDPNVAQAAARTLEMIDGKLA
jgi:ABC-type lipoprotein export system ATPase subunit